MTTEEKLSKCVEFIKKIEVMNIPYKDIRDLVEINGECMECGSDDVSIGIAKPLNDVVDAKVLEDLKESAWHILVDIT